MGEKLGQHFLRNKAAIKKIVQALNLQSGDTIIEIGSGHGELTQEIKNQRLKIKIIGIEKDKKLAEALRNKLGNEAKVLIGDALKILPLIATRNLKTTNYKVAGNIPYYITGKLLRILSELKNKPALCVFMFQKEVAERIAAKSPKMNRLAAITQFWAKPEIIAQVPKENFSPQPKVDSAVVKLIIKSQMSNINEKNYYDTTRILFQQPRKTILNNLVSKTKPQASNAKKEEIADKLNKIGINPADRPQNLNIEDIIKISKILRWP